MSDEDQAGGGGAESGRGAAGAGDGDSSVQAGADAGAGVDAPAAVKTGRRALKTVVTYLEMRKASHAFVPPPANLRMTLMRAERPTVHFYRYLYDTIGERYHWVDRRRLSDAALKEIIQAETVSIFVAYAHGVPAGFFELDERGAGEIWLAYFGIMPEFQGRGIGKWLLAEAIDEAFSRDPEVLRVETCTLDDPRALPLYQKMGFVPYERREKTVVID